MNTIQVLNRIIALHASSLPQYLTSAPPHVGYGEEKAWEILRNVATDQKLMIDKLADVVEDLDGTPNMGEFPAEFTGYHDLSMDYIVADALSRQLSEQDAIESLSTQLPSGSLERTLAQEALGASKGHVESLRECESLAKAN